MGYYIQVPENHNKAEQLKALHGAEILPCMPAWDEVPEDKAVICVIDNGSFEAAGLCYSKQEFDGCAEPDDIGPAGPDPVHPHIFHLRSSAQEAGFQRPRTWVLMDKELAWRLAGYEG